MFQEKGKHDYAEITFPSFSNFFYNVLKTGVPVKVTWYNEKGTGEFIGYVYAVTMTSQSTLVRPVIVKALGAGFLMKQSENKVWTNKTVSQIVSEIAQKFSLTPKVTPSKLLFSQHTMIGHTYWEKVLEFAERVGYVTQVIGTELHFHPIDKMIDQFITSVPVLSFQDAELDYTASYDGQTLDRFKPTIGDYVEHGQPNKKIKTISGIDPVTGKLFKKTASPTKVGKNLRQATTDPFFSEFVPNRIANDEASAQDISEALAQLARWSIPAEGTAQGDARIAPYRTVQINGTDSMTDSFWVITKAIHSMFFDGRYTVDFSCVTDGTKGLNTSAVRKEPTSIAGKRNIEYELSLGPSSKPTKSKLSSPKPVIKQTENGFAVNPSKWVGVK